MNGVFLFSTLLLFLVIHVLLQSTYHNYNTYRFIFGSSIPELVLFFLCRFTGEMDYFLNFLFSYLIILNFLFLFFTYFQKGISKLPHFFFLFFLLYFFVLYAISFHGKDVLISFSIPSLITCLSSCFFFFITFQKSHESFSKKRLIYIFLFFFQSFFLFFVSKIYHVSPILMGIIYSLPKGFVFLELKEAQNMFSYFLKEEFYHFFLLSFFDFMSPISIFDFQNNYLLKCCHFGMLSHMFFLVQRNKKEKWNLFFLLLFLVGCVFIFMQ